MWGWGVGMRGGGGGWGGGFCRYAWLCYLYIQVYSGQNNLGMS